MAKTKIIVELCQNHNGSREILERQIEEAAKNGADIVKMQSIWSEDLTRRERFEEGEFFPDGSVKTIKRPYEAERERLRKLDLSIDDHIRFIKKCGEFGVSPMTTIFSRSRIPEIAALPWPDRSVKVASYDCASLPFQRKLAEHFDRLFISTGATYNEEIVAAAELMRGLGKNFVLLHCVTSYPNSLEMAHLSRLEWLRELSELVGWSDHTLVERDGVIAAKAAIYLDADYVERHFTVLPASQTKDGPVSINPQLLRELSDFRNYSKEEQREIIEREKPDWKIMLGDPNREMTPTELLNRDYYRGRFASRTSSGGWVYNWEE